MMDSLPIPWNRYGIIAELACRLKGASPQFGKTALQKSVYLLQALYGVDCGYDFSLYAYGPFCSDLLGDLDTTGTLGGVQVHALGWGLDGYQIEPGPRSDAIREKAKAFLDNGTVQDSLTRLREDLAVSRPKTWSYDRRLSTQTGTWAATAINPLATNLRVLSSRSSRGSPPKASMLPSQSLRGKGFYRLGDETGSVSVHPSPQRTQEQGNRTRTVRPRVQRLPVRWRSPRHVPEADIGL